jgi:hypothetical protein
MSLGRTCSVLCGLVVIAGIAVLYAFPPSQYGFYPRCPIYSTTHLLCPGCGATRALYELLHLNLKGAVHYNALVTLLLPVALMWWALECYSATRQNRSMELRLPPAACAALLVIAALFTITRNTGLAFSI